MKSRREFVRNTTLAAAAALTGCKPESSYKVPKIKDDKVFEWKVVTTWPPNFPVLGEAVVKMAEEIALLSNNRLKIKVFGAGELVQALEVFDAVTLGAAQMGHGTPYYWSGKMPATIFFVAVPFGFNAQQMNAWMFYGGGLELWQELYGKVGLTVFPCGNTGVQMGGWFNKEINTPNDLKGLKMRIPGMGGKVIASAGGAAVTIAGGEIYTSLERGVVDAAEWIGPYHDYILGLHRVAKFYYYPGWQEPGSNLELMINKKAFEELPEDLKNIVKTVALKYHLTILAEFEAKNNFYLQKLLSEGAQLRAFPHEVLELLKQKSEEVLREIVQKDEFSKRVFESMEKFKKDIKQWNKISELAVVNYL
jgi:TRAP-type mannitol/chloroaromatic compound transport system substrate-binding protein